MVKNGQKGWKRKSYTYSPLRNDDKYNGAFAKSRVVKETERFLLLGFLRGFKTGVLLANRQKNRCAHISTVKSQPIPSIFFSARWRHFVIMFPGLSQLPKPTSDSSYVFFWTNQTFFYLLHFHIYSPILEFFTTQFFTYSEQTPADEFHRKTIRTTESWFLLLRSYEKCTFYFFLDFK